MIRKNNVMNTAPHQVAASSYSCTPRVGISGRDTPEIDVYLFSRYDTAPWVREKIMLDTSLQVKPSQNNVGLCGVIMACAFCSAATLASHRSHRSHCCSLRIQTCGRSLVTWRRIQTSI